MMALPFMDLVPNCSRSFSLDKKEKRDVFSTTSVFFSSVPRFSRTYFSAKPVTGFGITIS